MNPVRPLAFATALACAGVAFAADPAPQSLPLAPSHLKSPTKIDASRISAPPNSHHEMRGTVMADGSVHVDCVEVAGGIEQRHGNDRRVPTEAK